MLGSARLWRAGFGVAPKQSFLRPLLLFGSYELTGKVRDREDALASRREARATQRVASSLPGATLLRRWRFELARRNGPP